MSGSLGPDDSTFWTVIGGTWSAFLVVIGFLFRTNAGRIAEMKRDKDEAHAEIWRALHALTASTAALQVRAEERYARAEEVNKLFERIDTKLDKLSAQQNHNSYGHGGRDD